MEPGGAYSPNSAMPYKNACPFWLTACSRDRYNKPMRDTMTGKKDAQSAALCERIGYTFQDRSLLRQALTHSSYAYENNHRDNERLEFLGDAVLGMVCSEYLFKNCPQKPEGDLTRMKAASVSEGTLARAAREIGLGDFLFLGQGEAASGGADRDSILSDTMEALFAAVLLDGGMERARKVILHVMEPYFQSAYKGRLFSDYKTALQEELQKNPGVTIEYEIIREQGPDHQKTFTARVLCDGKELGRGTGKSKKDAEQQAAKDALHI